MYDETDRSFDMRAMREEYEQLCDAAAKSRSDEDLARIEELDRAIKRARPILRLCDKVKRLTDGRMIPVVDAKEGEPLTIGGLTFYAGTEGPDLMNVKGEASIKAVLRAQIIALEMSNGVTFKQREAA